MAKTKHLRYERVLHLPNVVIPTPGEALGKLPWQEAPWDTRPMILELGCGKGEHGLKLAEAHRSTPVLGVDIKSHRLCNGGEEGMALGFDNLFFLRADIGEIQNFVRPGTVGEIWIPFPDPHPKKREIKHRLTAPGFMAVYASLLVPGGVVHLKTDSRPFYEFTRGTVHDWGGSVLTDTDDLHGDNPSVSPVSAFEAAALSRGKTVKYIAFTLN